MRNHPALRIACIQLSASADWEKNWKQTEQLLLKAVRGRAQMVVLPENFIARATDQDMNSIVREAVPVVLSALKIFSKKHRIAVVAGSVPELLTRHSSTNSKVANTSYVFSAAGEQVLKYRKMHLFDVQLPGVRVQESRSVLAGKKPGFFKLNGISFGVGICYDLRFPEFFRVLSQHGAEVILIPANFTAKTGKTAWEVLVRARAIENQCYVVAAGQYGRHPGSGVLSYGNSMIVDPWGQIMKRASFSTAGVLMVNLDLSKLRSWRAQLPALTHRKIRCQ